ncbi:hypothetical protein BACCELL_01640 [Bacteroides cellulosilyticus DSM 14838]|uniref:Uncharacterized protein n=1 Tax=Bacteroides cellulosilyticus DSM 14838 TaxID=537012 RepID=E2NBI3_9BACE|nr:hypothetical protein BACCELL_01640 [Bacteroides cellulosilyticus DSM 14838]
MFHKTIPELYLLRTNLVLSSCRGTSEWRMYGASTVQTTSRHVAE